MRARAFFVLPYGANSKWYVETITLGNMRSDGQDYVDRQWTSGVKHANRHLSANIPLNGTWSPESVAAAIVGNTSAETGYSPSSSHSPQLAPIESWRVREYSATADGVAWSVLVLEIVWTVDRCRDGSVPHAGRALGCPISGLALGPPNSIKSYYHVPPSWVMLTDDDLASNGAVTGPPGALRELLEAVALPIEAA